MSEKEPAHRYATALPGRGLRRHLAGGPILARPAGAVSALGLARRHPGGWTLPSAAVLLLTVVAGLGLWVWKMRQEADRVADRARVCQGTDKALRQHSTTTSRTRGQNGSRRRFSV
jgi:cytoskeletal protein RodZ